MTAAGSLRRRRLLAWVGLLLVTLAASTPATGSDARAGGRLARVLSNDLELLGDLWIDVPLVTAARGGAFFALDTRTSIEGSDGVTLAVRDLQYDVRFGGRRGALVAEAGQRGKERVDADGRSFVRYVALGVESSGSRVAWRLSGGPVLSEHEVSAEAIVRGALRARLARLRRTPDARLALDLELDGLVDDGRLRAQLAGGPRLMLDVGNGRRASLFLHSIRGRNPLGLDGNAALVGFAYEKESGDGHSSAFTLPEIDAQVMAGGGEGRFAGGLALRFRSPGFGGGYRGVVLVDANVLTAPDTSDLYYLYHAGVERSIGGPVAGAYFYHRSNHTLDAPGPGVTSLNVLEAGIETAEYERLERDGGPRGRWGALDARVRAGWLVDSSFGEDHRWHARGGLHWMGPGRRGGPAPYARAEAEAGDIRRETYALGLALACDVAVGVEYRIDEQYFSRDRTALLLTVRYGL